MLLVSFCSTFIIPFALSAPVQISGLVLPTAVQQNPAINSSSLGSKPPLSKAVVFHIPSTRYALKLKLGKPVDPRALTVLLAVANASIEDSIERYGRNFYSYAVPFAYDLGDDIEVRINSQIYEYPPPGFTWGQLQTILHGIWLYQIEGQHSATSDFDILDIGPAGGNVFLGWGRIQKPMRKGLLEHASSNQTASSKRDFKREVQDSRRTDRTALDDTIIEQGQTTAAPNPALKRDSGTSLRLDDVSTSSTREVLNSSLPDSNTFNGSLPNLDSPTGGTRGRFQIPGTDLTLKIYRRNPLIDSTVMETLLKEAHWKIYQEVVSQGGEAPMTGDTFRYRLDGPGISFELINTRPAPKTITWQQLADVVEGLALNVATRQDYRACYVTIFTGEPEVEIGLGKISKSIILPHQNISMETAWD